MSHNACNWFLSIEEVPVQPPDGRIQNEAVMRRSNSSQSLQYDLDSIRLATKNFSAENKLGEGGFGPVYKVIQILHI